jgi:uncharacterized membrane protein
MISLINVGADLVGAIATIFAIIPIVSRAAKGRVQSEQAIRTTEPTWRGGLPARLAVSRRRRTQSVAVLAGLTTVAAWLVVSGGQYQQNILINVGADLVGAIATIFAIIPIVSRAAKGRVQSEQAIRGAERSARFLFKIIVWLLPPSERDRYSEEFHAELLDVDPGTRLRHVLSLLGGFFVLRLCRGLKKEMTDATARKTEA